MRLGQRSDVTSSDVEGAIGAGRHEQSGERTTCRNGYRARTLDTRLGSLQLRINDEWQLQHRHMHTEAMAELTPAIHWRQEVIEGSQPGRDGRAGTGGSGEAARQTQYQRTNQNQVRQIERRP